jgi:hypothetical protein
MRRYTLLLLFSLAPVFAQGTSATHPVQMVFTGKEWRGMPREAKVFLMAGYMAGYTAAVGFETSTCEPKLAAPPTLTTKEWIAGLDRFYSIPNNERVSLTGAWVWVLSKARGVSDDDLEQAEKQLRRP